MELTGSTNYANDMLNLLFLINYVLKLCKTIHERVEKEKMKTDEIGETN